MEINYIIRGSGFPFFFQHGLGGNISQPQELLDFVEGIQLISLDCRGHGKTPFDKAENISFDQYTNDLTSLADQLCIEQAIFGGISMGAGVALNLALQYPKKVKALVLVRPAWLDKPHPQNLDILKLLANLMEEGRGEELIRHKDFIGLEQVEYNTAQSVLKQLGREQPEYTSIIFKKMIADCPFSNLSELRELKIPVLILASKDDALHPYEIANSLKNAIPNSILIEVPSKYLHKYLHELIVGKEIIRFLSKVK